MHDLDVIRERNAAHFGVFYVFCDWPIWQVVDQRDNKVVSDDHITEVSALTAAYDCYLAD